MLGLKATGALGLGLESAASLVKALVSGGPAYLHQPTLASRLLPVISEYLHALTELVVKKGAVGLNTGDTMVNKTGRTPKQAFMGLTIL